MRTFGKAEGRAVLVRLLSARTGRPPGFVMKGCGVATSEKRD